MAAVADPGLGVIRIAAAVITDEGGRVLLVRKAGTRAFMQPGGKIEAGEAPLAALVRELQEELGLSVADGGASFLGVFSALAANEPGRTVEAALFHVRADGLAAPASEIAEMAWVDPRQCGGLDLAPLTREHVLPLLTGPGRY